jgi:hypothetical protein
MEDNIDRIRDELEEARENLQRTVGEVNRKVETVGTRLQPGHLMERHPLLSICVAGALGFASGDKDHVSVGILMLGGLLGAMLIETWNDGSRSRHATS